ncbi:MAG: hypothetical protein NT158_05150 [Cyanobacteria bacterium]|nr:hypothetical protein [Cyanobacteriota bacterium]
MSPDAPVPTAAEQARRVVLVDIGRIDLALERLQQVWGRRWQKSIQRICPK